MRLHSQNRITEDVSLFYFKSSFGLHEKDFGKTVIAHCITLCPEAAHFAVDVCIHLFPFMHVFVDGDQKRVALYRFCHSSNFDVRHMIAVLAHTGETIGIIDVAIAFVIKITGFTLVGNDDTQLYASVHECFANTVFSQHKSKKTIYCGFILFFKKCKNVFIIVVRY
jgi:hypothetical protein